MPAHFKQDDKSKAFEYNGRILYPMENGKFYERKLTKYSPNGQRFYWKYANCHECGKQILKPIYQISRQNGKVSCGKDCSIKMKSGPNHWLWKPKTEKVRANGKTALRIWMPDHPFARKGRVYEHRIVMEQKIGRLLSEVEVVHHIDCDSHNNVPENLALCPNGSSHLLAHGSLNYCVKELIKRKLIGFDHDKLNYYIIDK
jgi:hypothetical protein